MTEDQPTGPSELAEQDPRPVVALPRQGLPGAAIAGIAAVAAIALFAVINGQRNQGDARLSTAMQSATDAFVPPPPLTIPPEPPPIVEAVPSERPPVIVSEAAPMPAPLSVQPSPPQAPAPIFPLPAVSPEPPVQADRARPNEAAPALVFDAGEPSTAAVAVGAPSAQGRGVPAGGAAGQGASINDSPARAGVIGNKATTMPTGTLIPAVLETPIDTARPGLVRAVVSQDARGFDGSRVLVPRGSRLIGEYQADVRSGQNRVLVTWLRVIRPDGATIRLGSPASDPLGGAGVPGRVNTFFFERFAGAVLQSALSIGVNLASRPGNGSVIVGLPTGPLNNVVGQGLIPNDLRPKIKVRQGAKVNVFVARDLDFAGVPTKP